MAKEAETVIDNMRSQFLEKALFQEQSIRELMNRVKILERSMSMIMSVIDGENKANPDKLSYYDNKSKKANITKPK